MKQKKRYILVRLENSAVLEKIPNIRIISNDGNHAIVLCHLDKLAEVVLSLEKESKIITVSGTLKSLRSRV